MQKAKNGMFYLDTLRTNKGHAVNNTEIEVEHDGIHLIPPDDEDNKVEDGTQLIPPHDEAIKVEEKVQAEPKNIRVGNYMEKQIIFYIDLIHYQCKIYM